MAAQRDARGRFVAQAKESLSPAYRQRVESALARGKDLAGARGHHTQPLRQWQTPDAFNRPGYEKALGVLNRMRQGKSLSQAAKEAHTTSDSVRRYVGSALEQGKGGQFVAKPTDRLYRKMRFYDAKGALWVEPFNSKEASKLAEYHNAVDHYLRTGDDRPLRRFRRMRLRTRQKTGLPFITDPRDLDHLARAGELSFESIYQYTA